MWWNAGADFRGEFFVALSAALCVGPLYNGSGVTVGSLYDGSGYRSVYRRHVYGTLNIIYSGPFAAESPVISELETANASDG